MNNGIQFYNLSKTYGKVKALQHVTLDIHPGELFGLIGPDGAGKTTLFRILTTLVLADEGDASVCGWDVRKELQKIRCHVGYMPGRFSLYQDLTIEENLRFFATVFHTTLEENYDLIRDIYQQIEPFKHRRAGRLSGGMKQKLALCCALIHRPDVLFLDEPTTGVDPVSRTEFWVMLEQLKGQGITILVSTPYMDEAARCDRIALMREGHILTVNTPEGIRRDFNHQLLAIKANEATSMYPLLQQLRAYPQTKLCFSFGDTLHLTLKKEEITAASVGKDKEEAITELQTFLNQRGFPSVSIQAISPSIEDCFMLL